MRSLGLALVALALLPAAAAASDRHALGGHVGAGALSDGGAFAAASRPGLGYGGATAQGAPITIVLKPLRRSIADLRFAWRAACSDGQDRYVTSRMPVIPLRRGGRFNDAARDTDSLGGSGSVEYLDMVSGRLSARRASGTLRSQFIVRDPTGATVLTCDTGSLSWVARDSYAGKAGFQPLTIETPRDRRKVGSISSAFLATCKGGSEYLYFGTSPSGPAPSGPVEDGKDVLEPAAVARSGAFSATTHGSRAVDFGVSAFVTQHISGRIGASGGKGSFSAHVDVVDRATGSKLDECDTGSVRWTAVQ